MKIGDDILSNVFMVVFFIFYLIILSTCDWRVKIKNSDNFILKYLILSTKITDDKDPAEVTNILKNGLYFDIEFNSKLRYKIYIRYKPAVVVTTKTEFFIFENDVPISDKFEYELLEGFVVGEEYSSYVLGYVEDVFFYGKIQIADTVFYLEKLANYPEIIAKYHSTKNAISFTRTFPSDTEENIPGINYKPESNSKLFKRMAVRGNICSLLVLLDNSFITHIHHGNIKAAIKQVLLTIDEANSLFRSTDFDEDGFPDNIGFVIKYFILLKSSSKSRWVPKYTDAPIDGGYYMNRFSRFYLLEDVCLGVAFTGQSFYNDIVGISYSAVPPDEIFKRTYGGICDRPTLNPYGLPLNTLAVSAKSTIGRIVPEHIFELSLCHEFGHSFGSDHDKGKCDGHLMTAHAPADQKRKHFVFSKCSTASMLETIINKGQCFFSDDTPYCGNGIIETNEECDCGTIRDCLEFDKCCVPHGRNNSCKVKVELGYQCHPSQGFCCTSDCVYNNLEKYDLDCTHFQRSCPCTQNSVPCKCGIGGYCTNNICSSEECTRIGAEECRCPEPLQSGCQTCCLLTTRRAFCTPANKLTKLLVERGDFNFTKLELSNENKKTNTNYGFYEKFCGNDKCVEVYFRRVNTTDYCLLFGQVGQCSENNECILPQQKSFKLRQLESKYNEHDMINMGHKTLDSLSTKLLVIYFILLL